MQSKATKTRRSSGQHIQPITVETALRVIDKGFGPAFRGFETPTYDRLEAMEHFRKYKQHVIDALGPSALYDDQILQFGFDVFGARFGGAVHADHDLKPNKYYIVNTGGRKSKGIHWVAVYIKDKVAYVYDSYGRPTHSVLPRLKDNIVGDIQYIVDSDHHAEQRGYSQLCGQLSLAWLMVLHFKGLEMALRI